MSVSYRRLATALVAAVLAVTASVAYAQRIWVGGGRFYRTAPKWATPANFDGSFNFCRAFYTSDRREDGGSGWDTDFPGADNNFSVRLAELTFVRVRLDQTGQPDYVVLRLTDPLLARCPFLHFEDSGTARFTDEEVASLRAYLLKGGFLTVDDFWGTARVGSMGRGDQPRPAAQPVSDRRHPAESRDHAHAVRRERDRAGVVDSVLAPQWRQRLGASLDERQPPREFPRHLR